MISLAEANPEQVEKCAEILKVIAHPSRLTIVEILHDNQELSVTEIYEILGVEQAVASHHLALLRNKGIISSKRNGKHVYYELKLKNLINVVQCIKTCGIHSV